VASTAFGEGGRTVGQQQTRRRFQTRSSQSELPRRRRFLRRPVPVNECLRDHPHAPLHLQSGDKPNDRFPAG